VDVCGAKLAIKCHSTFTCAHPSDQRKASHLPDADLEQFADRRKILTSETRACRRNINKDCGV
jgi:hypothetical protein